MTLPLLGYIFAPHELIIIGVLALLLFGKRLPEVGRSLGKGIVEFKKGLAGIEDDVARANGPAHAAAPQAPAPPALPAGYRFDPYTGKPLAESVAQQVPPPQAVPQPVPSGQQPQEHTA